MRERKACTGPLPAGHVHGRHRVEPVRSCQSVRPADLRPARECEHRASVVRKTPMPFPGITLGIAHGEDRPAAQGPRAQYGLGDPQAAVPPGACRADDPRPDGTDGRVEALLRRPDERRGDLDAGDIAFDAGTDRHGGLD